MLILLLLLLLLLLPLPQIPGCRDGVVSWRWDCGTGTSTQQPHHYHLHHSFSHLNYELSSEWAIYLIARLHHGSHWCSCHAVVFPTESPAKQWERDAAHALPVTCVYLVACISHICDYECVTPTGNTHDHAGPCYITNGVWMENAYSLGI